MSIVTERVGMQQGPNAGVVNLLRMARNECRAVMAFVATAHDGGSYETATFPPDGGHMTLPVEAVDELVRQTLSDPEFGHGGAFVRSFGRANRAEPLTLAVVPLGSAGGRGMVGVIGHDAESFATYQLEFLERMAQRLARHLEAREELHRRRSTGGPTHPHPTIPAPWPVIALPRLAPPGASPAPGATWTSPHDTAPTAPTGGSVPTAPTAPTGAPTAPTGGSVPTAVTQPAASSAASPGPGEPDPHVARSGAEGGVTIVPTAGGPAAETASWPWRPGDDADDAADDDDDGEAGPAARPGSDAGENADFSEARGLFAEMWEERDELTGLPPLGAFCSRVGRVLGREGPDAGPVVVAVVELVGTDACLEQVVRQAAEALRGHLRFGDPVARIGGAAFAVAITLAPGSTRGEVVEERLAGAVRAAVMPEAPAVTLRTSHAVAEPGDRREADELLRLAVGELRPT